MIALYLVIATIVGYLIGNINFARIFSWHLRKKDITQIGSKNPGTMNMLRSHGLKEAVLTLIFEAIKVGGPAIACFFIFQTYLPGYENLAYFLSSFGGILGHCFPVFYKFKGGKGVACTFGMFLFHPLTWWVSLIAFVVCFIAFLFIPFPFIVTNSFILIMATYTTCIFVINNLLWWIPIVVILWVNFAIIIFLHRGNIKRLIAGNENKVYFREKIFKKKKKETAEVTSVETKTQQEKKNDKTTSD
ncbi:MAG: glycerol-3-phosphate acyltransferase [Clostridia bacterium]|nr:glycerol-3-phosphate acyltransferase [Clostridia bacterium]